MEVGGADPQGGRLVESGPDTTSTINSPSIRGGGSRDVVVVEGGCGSRTAGRGGRAQMTCRNLREATYKSLHAQHRKLT